MHHSADYKFSIIKIANSEYIKQGMPFKIIFSFVIKKTLRDGRVFISAAKYYLASSAFGFSRRRMPRSRN
jgi:hypothetical protein